MDFIKFKDEVNDILNLMSQSAPHLRNEIVKIIEEQNGDIDSAAKKILVFLEDHIGLHGNGWFDNDPEMVAYLGYEDH